MQAVSLCDLHKGVGCSLNMYHNRTLRSICCQNRVVTTYLPKVSLPVRRFVRVCSQDRDRNASNLDYKTVQTMQSGSTNAQPPVQDLQIPFLLVSVLAASGAAETAYLSMVKLFDAPLVCPATGGGCETVLNSEWANFFGVPLPFLGFLSYSSVAGIALLGRERSTRGAGKAKVPSPHWVDSAIRSSLLGGGILLASCSAFLMFILLTKFPGDYCTWCIGSALLSLSILLAVTSGLSKRELQDAAAPSFTAVGTIALVLAFNFGSISNSQAEALDIPYQEPPVQTSSSNRAISLAKQLKDAGATMYGAFWCSHCYDQKVAFGREAMADFPYIECYPDGFRKGVKIAPQCDAAGIRGFPTWVIGQDKLEGEQSFDTLENALYLLKSNNGSDGSAAQQQLMDAP